MYSEAKECFSGCSGGTPLFFKTLTGKHISIGFNPTDRVEDLKQSIFEKERISPDQIRMVFAGRQLEDGNTLQDYSIQKDSTVYLVLRLRSGPSSSSQYRPIRKHRNLVEKSSNELISIIAKQNIEGCWSDVPNEIKNIEYKEMSDILAKISKWSKTKGFGADNDKVIGSISSLVFMKKFLLNEFKTWELVYEKGLKYLKSINEGIKWENIIKDLL